MPVAVHAEDRALLVANEEKLKQAKKIATADYLRAHTEAVELKAVQRLLKLSEPTGVRLHFCHVSTEEGLNAIAEAKKSGRTVTCEVTPNHLLLSSDDLKRYGQLVIMAPPLRSKTNVDALWKGIEKVRLTRWAQTTRPTLPARSRPAAFGTLKSVCQDWKPRCRL